MVLVMPEAVGAEALFIDEELARAHVCDLGEPARPDAREHADAILNQLPRIHTRGDLADDAEGASVLEPRDELAAEQAGWGGPLSAGRARGLALHESFGSIVAQVAEVSVDDFKALNPSAHRPVMLAGGTPQILLPWDNAEIFQRNMEAHSGKLASWTAWVAPQNMKVADAAKRVGMSEEELRSINKIPPRMLIKAGSALLVPRSASQQKDVSVKVADTGQLNLAPEQVLRKQVVKARKGEMIIRVTDANDVYVPRFCYHERMKPVGMCRMCLVEVVGGPPKPAASCAMQVRDLRPGPNGEAPVVKTKSPMVKKAREGVMEFHPIANIDELNAGTWGILEPRAEAQICAPAEIDLLLCPGLAFTMAGHRLGKGKGYYDRYLTRFINPRPPCYGVTFSAFVCESIPCEPHDAMMDWVIDETTNGIADL